jgi:prefoldin subunit 5
MLDLETIRQYEDRMTAYQEEINKLQEKVKELRAYNTFLIKMNKALTKPKKKNYSI